MKGKNQISMAMLEIKDKIQNHKSNHKNNSNATLFSNLLRPQIYSAPLYLFFNQTILSALLFCIFSSPKPSNLLCSAPLYLSIFSSPSNDGQCILVSFPSMVFFSQTLESATLLSI